ncbi:hypothetical protein TWF481_006004 [Arthrobotrys musiformis]|uniref:Phosphatidate phosphatase APP1 catalytic domain-containing protein n=1 Tax=Arthrobotrys musiformis TaxID=47236 RepID=A0AAV9WH38_9PEZI
MFPQNLLQAAAIAAVASSALASPVQMVPRDDDPIQVVPRDPVENLPRGLPLVTDEVLLMDSPAFRDGETGWTASVRMFTYVRQIKSTLASAAIKTAIEAFGVEVGNKAENLFERSRLFLAIPRKGIEVDLEIQGCDSTRVGSTAASGLMERNAGIGSCRGGVEGGRKMTAFAPGFFKRRGFEGTLFPSLPDGWAIVSDVDDTIKVSNVLDKKKQIQSLFLDEHEAVEGMPQLYDMLDAKLNPAWFYLTGSPYQLYPTLRQFIIDGYPTGPLLMKNLTFTNIKDTIEYISKEETLGGYKVEQLEKLQGYYPEKKFITIGDSTQYDPEAYAEFARRYPDVVQCIWIRKVDGADNSHQRFEEAFKGVPEEKWLVFEDAWDVMPWDVADGKCK